MDDVSSKKLFAEEEGRCNELFVGRMVANYKITVSAKRATLTFTFTFTAAETELTAKLQP